VAVFLPNIIQNRLGSTELLLVY